MSNDPLDKETSIGAELTPAGLKVNARSRFIAAVDRFCGNIVDLGNVPMERRLSRERAKIEGEKQLIEGMTRAALERMSSDPEFAERAIRNHLGTAFERQENKDGVMRHALEDLRREPESEDATPDLDPAFANRFERHMEDAATEQLREKWGRVLAAEIRKPGSVTPRVMRIVDEIDAETAESFEKICEWHIHQIIPVVLSGVDARQVRKLVGAGLLTDPNLAKSFVLNEVEDSEAKYWFAKFGGRGFGLPRDFAFASLGPFYNGRRVVPLIVEQKKPPAIPVFLLTDEGLAVSSILPDRQQLAFDAYIDKLRATHPQLPIKVFESAGQNNWRLVFDPLSQAAPHEAS
jgi:hypothetical protein